MAENMTSASSVEPRPKSVNSRRFCKEKEMTRTPLEDYAKKSLETARKVVKMDKELAKYGRPAGGVSKGMVWTVGDLARYFEDTRKRKRK
jgi:hypothetical protein